MQICLLQLLSAALTDCRTRISGWVWFTRRLIFKIVGMRKRKIGQWSIRILEQSIHYLRSAEVDVACLELGIVREKSVKQFAFIKSCIGAGAFPKHQYQQCFEVYLRIQQFIFATRSR